MSVRQPEVLADTTGASHLHGPTGGSPSLFHREPSPLLDSDRADTEASNTKSSGAVNNGSVQKKTVYSLGGSSVPSIDSAGGVSPSTNNSDFGNLSNLGNFSNLANIGDGLKSKSDRNSSSRVSNSSSNINSNSNSNSNTNSNSNFNINSNSDNGINKSNSNDISNSNNSSISNISNNGSNTIASSHSSQNGQNGHTHQTIGFSADDTSIHNTNSGNVNFTSTINNRDGSLGNNGGDNAGDSTLGNSQGVSSLANNRGDGGDSTSRLYNSSNPDLASDDELPPDGSSSAYSSSGKDATALLYKFRFIVLLVYPIIIFLGELVHISQPEGTYFSNKRNIFNVFFVKRAWLWTTLAFIAIVVRAKVATNSTSGPGIKSATQSGSILKAQSYAGYHLVLRYAAATFWWVLFTQWFFGLPIMDRVFVLTGGGCDGLVEKVAEAAMSTNPAPGDATSPLPPLPVTSNSPLNNLVSSAYCRAHGGTWVGGYDPSGHTFLLVHASLFLWFELLPLIVTGRATSTGTGIGIGSAIGTSTSGSSSGTTKPATTFTTSLSVRLVLGLLAFWAWMVLMTAVYFHSFLEKLLGLVCGYLEVLLVYVVAANHPQLGAILGV
ncbi:Scs3p [Sugiyamaella lignohabitans]|uniref:Acyl-coenzyme A diphosphatase SCS3 n=1 Tax=Sugiyamaella lignohabitans TaxID=796027 RepID=A0A167C699_9ASCO|nr:Scs3p [Sugiyamaella lignohabitans]ANB11273.1 Scs3p [Sugiyamaella lignohabitans]